MRLARLRGRRIGLRELLLGVVLLIAAVAIVLGFVLPFGAPGGSRVSRCAERIAARATPGALSREALRRYAERGYCVPFNRRGWVYADGTLKLAAYTRSRECSVSGTGGTSSPISCREAEGGLLDCALLRLVRRVEAQRYIAKLRHVGDVRCDDGTSLETVGA